MNSYLLCELTSIWFLMFWVRYCDLVMTDTDQDTPEIFWSEPALEPLYMALRGYLEISQR